MSTTPRPKAGSARDLRPRGDGHRRAQRTLSWPRLRSATVALIALGALGALTVAPTSAAARVPLPDPPAVRLPLLDVGVAILTLAERYAEAPLTQKRLLHNDMVLVVNTSCSSS